MVGAKRLGEVGGAEEPPARRVRREAGPRAPAEDEGTEEEAAGPAVEGDAPAGEDERSAPPSAAAGRPRRGGRSLQGRRVRVHWAEDEDWYQGVVRTHVLDGMKWACHVVYDDGDSEWGDISTASMTFSVAAGPGEERPESGDVDYNIRTFEFDEGVADQPRPERAPASGNEAPESAPEAEAAAAAAGFVPKADALQYNGRTLKAFWDEPDGVREYIGTVHVRQTRGRVAKFYMSVVYEDDDVEKSAFTSVSEEGGTFLVNDAVQPYERRFVWLPQADAGGGDRAANAEATPDAPQTGHDAANPTPVEAADGPLAGRGKRQKPSPVAEFPALADKGIRPVNDKPTAVQTARPSAALASADLRLAAETLKTKTPKAPTPQAKPRQASKPEQSSAARTIRDMVPQGSPADDSAAVEEARRKEAASAKAAQDSRVRQEQAQAAERRNALLFRVRHDKGSLGQEHTKPAVAPSPVAQKATPSADAADATPTAAPAGRHGSGDAQERPAARPLVAARSQAEGAAPDPGARANATPRSTDGAAALPPHGSDPSAQPAVDPAVLLNNLDKHLNELTRKTDSIIKGTTYAMKCARAGKPEEAIELLRGRLAREKQVDQQLNLFYVVDNIAQSSARERDREQSRGASSGPAMLSAIASRLFPIVKSACGPDDFSGAANKRAVSKTLNIWISRNIMAKEDVHPALVLVNKKLEASKAKAAEESAAALSQPSLGDAAQVAGEVAGKMDYKNFARGLLENEFGDASGMGLSLKSATFDEEEDDDDRERGAVGRGGGREGALGSRLSPPPSPRVRRDRDRDDEQSLRPTHHSDAPPLPREAPPMDEPPPPLPPSGPPPPPHGMPHPHHGPPPLYSYHQAPLPPPHVPPPRPPHYGAPYGAPPFVPPPPPPAFGAPPPSYGYGPPPTLPPRGHPPPPPRSHHDAYYRR